MHWILSLCLGVCLHIRTCLGGFTISFHEPLEISVPRIELNGGTSPTNTKGINIFCQDGHKTHHWFHGRSLFESPSQLVQCQWWQCRLLIIDNLFFNRFEEALFTYSECEELAFKYFPIHNLIGFLFGNDVVYSNLGTSEKSTSPVSLSFAPETCWQNVRQVTPGIIHLFIDASSILWQTSYSSYSTPGDDCRKWHDLDLLISQASGILLIVVGKLLSSQDISLYARSLLKHKIAQLATIDAFNSVSIIHVVRWMITVLQFWSRLDHNVTQPLVADGMDDFTPDWLTRR
jgi:hypothetical protein